MYFTREHQRLLSRLGLENVKDIEHFRVQADQVNSRYHLNPTSWSHYACLVLTSGCVYHGEAHTSYTDQYNRKRGYTISVGRALRRALEDPQPLLWVPTHYEGILLRDTCRAALSLPPYTLVYYRS